jgi:hypothetical protein
MPLTQVTFTGADDFTPINELLARSAERHAFWIEWGVLFSAKREGTGRYPRRGWIESLVEQNAVNDHGALLALHVCGREANDAFITGAGWMDSLTIGFDRIQLNLRQENHSVPDLRRAIQGHGRRAIITQDNTANETLMDVLADLPNHVVLFDKSGGRGKIPDSWPSVTSGPAHRVSPGFGYAGGLGAANLATELPRIESVCKTVPYWIDMESSLRDENDRFDLARVDATLAVLDALLPVNG